MAARVLLPTHQSRFHRVRKETGGCFVTWVCSTFIKGKEKRSVLTCRSRPFILGVRKRACFVRLLIVSTRTVSGHLPPSSRFLPFRAPLFLVLTTSGPRQKQTRRGVLNHACGRTASSVIGIMYGCVVLLAWVVRNLPNLRVKKRKKRNQRGEGRKMASLLGLVVCHIAYDPKVIIYF